MHLNELPGALLILAAYVLIGVPVTCGMVSQHRRPARSMVYEREEPLSDQNAEPPENTQKHLVDE
jgi:hypothetical protein